VIPARTVKPTARNVILGQQGHCGATIASAPTIFLIIPLEHAPFAASESLIVQLVKKIAQNQITLVVSIVNSFLMPPLIRRAVYPALA
jgi:hypothetical protein